MKDKAAMQPSEINDIVRECVSCKRCYPSNVQHCRVCLIELASIELIPYTIDSIYRLERMITRGGTGVVFAATNLERLSDVAIKVIRASAMADPRAQDRFHREVQLALDFNHPKIGAVYDFGMLPDASAYVVSEYIRGTSLRTEMNRTGKFKVADAVAIIGEAGEALDAAHRAGLVHRDLKPESMILTANSDQSSTNIKIVDFSFAKIGTGQQFIPGTTGRLQGQGQMPLQPTYLSPEQYRGEEADLRSDIYSLGVIIYEMISGQPPFTATRVGEFGLKLLNLRPALLRTFNPEINILMEAEILRALEKEPINRQQSALEFKIELENAIHLCG
jgi:serine/threonine protein kinase